MSEPEDGAEAQKLPDEVIRRMPFERLSMEAILRKLELIQQERQVEAINARLREIAALEAMWERPARGKS